MVENTPGPIAYTLAAILFIALPLIAFGVPAIVLILAGIALAIAAASLLTIWLVDRR